jgi:hypothetical protein
LVHPYLGLTTIDDPEGMTHYFLGNKWIGETDWLNLIYDSPPSAIPMTNGVILFAHPYLWLTTFDDTGASLSMTQFISTIPRTRWMIFLAKDKADRSIGEVLSMSHCDRRSPRILIYESFRSATPKTRWVIFFAHLYLWLTTIDDPDGMTRNLLGKR